MPFHQTQNCLQDYPSTDHYHSLASLTLSCLYLSQQQEDNQTKTNSQFCYNLMLHIQMLLHSYLHYTEPEITFPCTLLCIHHIKKIVK